MIHGEKVCVLLREQVGLDGYGEPVFEECAHWVECVVAPGTGDNRTSEEAEDSGRRRGDILIYTLHFPKTFTAEISDAHVIVRGKKLRVVGTPQCYTPENTPGKWNRQVQVRSIDG